jgi:hypothetical protein
MSPKSSVVLDETNIGFASHGGSAEKFGLYSGSGGCFGRVKGVKSAV